MITKVNYAEMDSRDAAKFIMLKCTALEKTLKELTKQIQQLAESRHLRDGMFNIENKFKALLQMATSHIKTEMELLLPICNNSKENGFKYLTEEDLSGLRDDHTQISFLLDDIRNEADNYKVLDNEAASIKLFLAKLSNLEQDMRKNMYLENNLLFPKLQAPKAFNYNRL